MKILDSDHCIAVMRGRLKLEDWVAPNEELAITTISIGELAHGAHKSLRSVENLASLDALLAFLTVLPYEQEAARHFGQIKADLEKAGTRLADLDLQIASIALHHRVPLVTHNQAHFKRVPGLLLEDWIE